MLQTFNSVILFICFQISLSQINIGKIGCKQTLPLYKYKNCSDPGCTAICINTCSEYKEIWGTEIYTYDSPICRAAVHDLRISTWNISACTVTFQYLYDTKEYVGSKRQNIQTLDYGKLNYSPHGAYFFKSPRIIEEILDIITLHHNYVIETGRYSNHTLECHVGSKAANRKIYFSKFSADEEFEVSPNRRGLYTYSWYEVQHYGDGFWCRPENSMLSGVVSHVIPKNSHFTPNRLTVTASIKDKMSIQMNTISDFYNPHWKKDGKEFSKYLNQFFGNKKKKNKLSFNSLKIGDAGFYRIDDDYTIGGMIRLIVRVCEDGKFGPLCEHRCPACMNGGVCHDLTGDCICPPGFNGTFCEKACEPGFFGKECNQQCYNLQNQVTNCAEILFCLPDPYGCSCISGLTSIFCNESCSFGYYGAGCTQTCSSHCKPSRQCEPTSGKCYYGCEDGWHGTTCSKSYPVFKTAPVVKSVSFNSIEFTFKEWTENNDNGVGTPEYYEIQYKEYMRSEWKSYKNIKADNLYHGSYDEKIENLSPDNIYHIRVVIIDVSRNMQLKNIPEFIGTTSCGVPQEPPVDIQINATLSRTISVTWKLPPLETWNCKDVSVNIRCKSTKSDILYNSATKQNYFWLKTEPYTEWNITLRVFNKNFPGKWSTVKTVVSAQDAPSNVKNLTLLAVKIDQIFVSWIKPEKENGILKKYIIEYKQIKWRHSCHLTNLTFLKKEINTKETFAYIDVYPHSKYVFKVFAETVKPGPVYRKEIQTDESVPAGPPQDLKTVYVRKDFVQLQWEYPICSLSYGNVTKFRYILNSLDPWETLHQHKVISIPEVIISTLQPFTNYKVRVYAGTKVGFSNHSAEISFKTKSDRPPSPSQMKIYDSTDNILFLSWIPPYPPKGILWKYEIQYHCEECSLMNKMDEIMFTAEVRCPNVVGNNRHCYALRNLKNNQKYIINIWAYNKNVIEKGEVASISGRTKESATHLKGFDIAGIIIAVLIILIIVIAFILFRNPKLRKHVPSLNIFINQRKEKDSITSSSNNLEEVAELEPISDVKSQKLLVSELENFVQLALKSGEIRNQFISVEKGQNQSWDISKKSENKRKNRYGNLLAYDSTRVILNKLTSDPHSDYINANYIDGYKIPKRYIATQGPKQLTINDFWRMIWQENVSKIIMSANLVENGKAKCEKYWPDSTETYGDLTVTLLNSEIFADYVIRTFRIAKERDTRQIKHFHFTTWPDHGVPMYAITVTNFIQKTRSYKLGNNKPIVVHCSAGIGRTGTLILLDSMLDMAEAEGQVDLVAHLYTIRQQRINMVETVDQYYFVYQCLVEALCREKTAIKCSEYVPKLKRLRTIDPNTGFTTFHLQFERLSNICTPLKVTDCRIASDPHNQGKNRNDEVLPPDRSLPILNPFQGNPAYSYVNAVYVDGYRQKDAFIVTQIPFPETTCDFWRMAYFSKTSTIVLLNDFQPTDENCYKYWPETTETYGDIQVKNVSEEKHGDFTIRIFELQNTSLKEYKVPSVKIMKQFHLNGWMPNDIIPSSAEVILNLIDKVERWQQNSGTSSVIVQCLNGVRACGLYCSSVFICDKIKSEQEVDVFLAVRSIRINRPQFIENVGQYIFCHQVALTYLEAFEMYANFKDIKNN